MKNPSRKVKGPIVVFRQNPLTREHVQSWTADCLWWIFQVITRGPNHPECPVDQHSFFELIYCKTGTCFTEINGKQYELKPGDWCIYNPGDKHRSYILPGSREIHPVVHYCAFDIPRWKETVLKATGEPRLPNTLSGFQEIIPYYRMIHHNLTSRDDFSMAMVNHALSMIFFQLLRLTVFKPRLQRAGRSMELVFSSVPKAASVQDLARQSYLSRSYFSRKFKGEHGMSPARYLTQQKIDFARQLLSNPRLSVKEIAAETGFDNEFYFSRVFKKVTGRSPSEFRKTIAL